MLIEKKDNQVLTALAVASLLSFFFEQFAALCKPYIFLIQLNISICCSFLFSFTIVSSELQ